MSNQPRVVAQAEVTQMLGLSRSKFYMLVADGEFEILKVGRCTLVLVASLHRFVERQRSRSIS